MIPATLFIAAIAFASEFMRTLFSPNFFEHHGLPELRGWPYSVALQAISEGSDIGIEDDELSVFQDVLSHEVMLYEPRGYIAGSMCINGVNLAMQRSPYEPVPLQAFPFAQGVFSLDKGVTLLLFVDSLTVFRALIKARPWEVLPMIVVTGCGVPRIETRWMIRDIVDRHAIPVYVLSDSDLWGYFIVSLLSRGQLSPSGHCDRIAISEVRFLGLTAQHVKASKAWRDSGREWRISWDARLQEIRRYPCFSSDVWQQEFDVFAENHVGVDLDPIVLKSPFGFVRDFLVPELSRCSLITV